METAMLNRQQRRMMKKQRADSRFAGFSQKQKDAYEKRAKLWLKGATVVGHHIDGEFDGEFRFPATTLDHRRQSVIDYATHSPLRWRIVARCWCRDDNGGKYYAERDAEAGQAQLFHELHDLREQLMRDAEKEVNARHVVDRIYTMYPLV